MNCLPVLLWVTFFLPDVAKMFNETELINTEKNIRWNHSVLSNAVNDILIKRREINCFNTFNNIHLTVVIQKGITTSLIS